MSEATCPHENFAAEVDVARLTRSDTDPTVVGYTAEVEIWCAHCGLPFHVYDLPAGLLPGQPTGSVDGRTLHIPLRPADAPPGFGLDLPGYTVQAIGAGPADV